MEDQRSIIHFYRFLYSDWRCEKKKKKKTKNMSNNNVMLYRPRLSFFEAQWPYREVNLKKIFSIKKN